MNAAADYEGRGRTRGVGPTSGATGATETAAAPTGYTISVFTNGYNKRPLDGQQVEHAPTGHAMLLDFRVAKLTASVYEKARCIGSARLCDRAGARTAGGVH